MNSTYYRRKMKTEDPERYDLAMARQAEAARKRRRDPAVKARQNKAAARYRAQNRELHNARSAAWRAAHPEQTKAAMKQWYEKNRDSVVERFRERDERVRRETVAAYGGKCICCGESNIRFLALDHVDDDGAERRRCGKKSGTTFYYQLKRDGYPNFIQVLCHNCNVSKGMYGFCPHGNCWRSMTTSA